MFLVLSVTMVGFLSVISHSVQASRSNTTFLPACASFKTLVSNTNLWITVMRVYTLDLSMISKHLSSPPLTQFGEHHLHINPHLHQCIVLRSVFGSVSGMLVPICGARIPWKKGSSTTLHGRIFLQMNLAADALMRLR